MKNYAVSAWNWVKAKLGRAVDLFAPVAKALSVAIEEGDIDKIKIHNAEAREFFQQGLDTCDFIDEAVADGNLDLYEGASALNKLNQLIDEGEDVITGVDEDDVPDDPTVTG